MKTMVDIDDDLLAAARVLLGTATKKDTVNAALAEVVAIRGRREAIAMIVDGELPDLLDAEVMAAAWR